MPFFSGNPIHRDIAQAASTNFDAPGSLACDVSFISDDSTPAQALLERECERQTMPQAALLLRAIYEKLRGVYDEGSFILHPACLRPIISAAIESSGVTIAPAEFESLVVFFDHVSGVMFQHQTLAWLSDCDFQIHLYGQGWQDHPTLARFARGTIESDAMRVAIYRASRINLAAGVNGAVGEELIQGISAGGFFLFRYCPADVIERVFPPLGDFCARHGITGNAQLRDRISAPASCAIRGLLDFLSHTVGINALNAWPDLPAALRDAAAAGYMRSAAAIWAHYPAVAFGSRDELIGMVGRYLYDGPERQRIAEDMRRQLVGRFDHIRINRHVLSATPNASEVAA